jgi:hypothetical protein
VRREEIVRVAGGLVLVAAAVLAIVIITGSEHDPATQKTLGTAAAVAFFTPLVAAGLAFSRRRPELGLIAHLGVAVALAGFAVVAVSVWSEELFGGEWRPAAYALVLALAGGQVAVLLALADPGDGNGLRLLRAVTIGALGIFVALVISEISGSGDETDVKGMAVAAVIYGAGTIVLLLASMLGRSTSPIQITATGPQLDHVGVPVAAWDHSAAFYRDVLGADARPAHAELSFAWDGSAASAIEHLHRHGVAVLGPPAPREGARGPGQSIYFRDPSGRLIELIAYG